ncbi:hypothetical protein FFF34_008935 [Inquilinus sp. KBS0705]|nr:hypothetical protein FFF34_008935 [Inquilinus sp. KBS0705]
MAASFHFVFELLKIAVLAAVYAGIFICLWSIRRNFKKEITKFSKIYLTVYVVLFVFMFTYYGDHGLGDESRIPIGHWEAIDASDGYPYFRPKGENEVRLFKYVVKSDVLCATVDSGYMAYDLNDDRLNKFASITDYESFASKNHLPLVKEFMDFYPQYDKYWGGWRFWLLP